MGTYGRNFDFRQSPIPQHRLGRFVNGATAVPQGAPVVASGAEDDNGRRAFALAADGASRPAPGQGGVAVYEVPDNTGLGLVANPLITRASDHIDVPADVSAQVCHGTEVRLAFWNTEEDDFDGMRTGANVYAARVMVAGASGATPTVAVDDFLVPGVGNDTDGYWKVGGTADTAWAIVTQVDTEIGTVTAQMLF